MEHGLGLDHFTFSVGETILSCVSLEAILHSSHGLVFKSHVFRVGDSYLYCLSVERKQKGASEQGSAK